jgi:hypothetical protein
MFNRGNVMSPLQSNSTKYMAGFATSGHLLKNGIPIDNNEPTDAKSSTYTFRCFPRKVQC